MVGYRAPAEGIEDEVLTQRRSLRFRQYGQMEKTEGAALHPLAMHSVLHPKATILADRKTTTCASTDAQTPRCSPRQAKAKRTESCALKTIPQHGVGMAEPIRRWLRLALGSKPGLPRGS
ncbi:hypothetical protein CCMA1212_008391 [Trichoderma ghanense]|uniref:Uncharacterized protein n=1 Tax=Trichoderma ghanense TaxID=65468 RepID=A0ABY2GWN7_9HYPO